MIQVILERFMDIAFVIAVLTSFNLVIVALAKFFEVIKDRTESKFDDKIAVVLHKVSLVLVKILNVLGARGAGK